MAECLVAARKKVGAHSTLARIHFTSLQPPVADGPQGFANAAATANRVTDAGYVRQVEDGPFGGTSVYVGDHIAGEMVTAVAGQDGDRKKPRLAVFFNSTPGCIRLFPA